MTKSKNYVLRLIRLIRGEDFFSFLISRNELINQEPKRR